MRGTSWKSALGVAITSMAMIVGGIGIGCKKKAKDAAGSGGEMGAAKTGGAKMGTAPMRPAPTGAMARPSMRPAGAMEGSGAMGAMAAMRPAPAMAGVATKPPPLKQMPKSAFKPTGRKPSYNVLKKLARTPEREGVAVWNIVPLGGPRWVAAVHGRVKGSPKYFFRLLCVEKKDGTWAPVWDYLVEKPKESFHHNMKPGKDGKKPKRMFGITVKIKDYDWDGKPEALVRYRYPDKEKNEIRKVAIVNLDGPKPRLAVVVTVANLFAEVGVGHTKGYVKFKDLNGDKRPDLFVHTAMLSYKMWRLGGASPAVEGIRTQYIWDWKTDTYIKGKSRSALKEMD